MRVLARTGLAPSPTATTVPAASRPRMGTRRAGEGSRLVPASQIRAVDAGGVDLEEDVPGPGSGVGVSAMERGGAFAGAGRA